MKHCNQVTERCKTYRSSLPTQAGGVVFYLQQSNDSPNPETRVARVRVAREMNGGLCDKGRKGLLF
jgi:hypothetical protein